MERLRQCINRKFIYVEEEEGMEGDEWEEEVDEFEEEEDEEKEVFKMEQV